MHNKMIMYQRDCTIHDYIWTVGCLKVKWKNKIPVMGRIEVIRGSIVGLTKESCTSTPQWAGFFFLIFGQSNHSSSSILSNDAPALTHNRGWGLGLAGHIHSAVGSQGCHGKLHYAVVRVSVVLMWWGFSVTPLTGETLFHLCLDYKGPVRQWGPQKLLGSALFC